MHFFQLLSFYKRTAIGFVEVGWGGAGAGAGAGGVGLDLSMGETG